MNEPLISPIFRFNAEIDTEQSLDLRAMQLPEQALEQFEHLKTSQNQFITERREELVEMRPERIEAEKIIELEKLMTPRLRPKNLNPSTKSLKKQAEIHATQTVMNREQSFLETFHDTHLRQRAVLLDRLEKKALLDQYNQKTGEKISKIFNREKSLGKDRSEEGRER